MIDIESFLLRIECYRRLCIPLDTISKPNPIMNKGHSDPILNQGTTFSSRFDSPIRTKNAPNINGKFDLPRPPKHSSSRSLLRVLYFRGSRLIGAPQFEHSVFSSALSVPHFVQYTKLTHNRPIEIRVIQRLRKNVLTRLRATRTYTHMCKLADPDPSPDPEHSD